MFPLHIAYATTTATIAQNPNKGVLLVTIQYHD